MRNANPSAIALLPTPGSPIKIGLFFFLRDKIWLTRSISFSRPTIGSNRPASAIFVKSLPKLSNTGVLDLESDLLDEELLPLDPDPDPPPIKEDKRLTGEIDAVKTSEKVDVISNEDAFEAMRIAFRQLRIVTEPGGAAALAAALFRLPDEAKGKTVGVVLTGGNVDPRFFADVLNRSV